MDVHDTQSVEGRQLHPNLSVFSRDTAQYRQGGNCIVADAVDVAPDRAAFAALGVKHLAVERFIKDAVAQMIPFFLRSKVYGIEFRDLLAVFIDHTHRVAAGLFAVLKALAEPVNQKAAVAVGKDLLVVVLFVFLCLIQGFAFLIDDKVVIADVVTAHAVFERQGDIGLIRGGIGLEDHLSLFVDDLDLSLMDDPCQSLGKRIDVIEGGVLQIEPFIAGGLAAVFGRILSAAIGFVSMIIACLI